MLVVAKRLGSAGARGREAGARNPVFKAILYRTTPNKLVQETGVEAVARSDSIDGLNWKSRHAITIGAALGNGPLCTTLNDHDGNEA